MGIQYVFPIFDLKGKGNCCLTPTQQFFSYIMARTS